MVLGVPLFIQFTLERFGSTARGYWLLRRELLTSDSDNVHHHGTRGERDLQAQIGSHSGVTQESLNRCISFKRTRFADSALASLSTRQPTGCPHLSILECCPTGRSQVARNEQTAYTESSLTSKTVIIAPSRLRDREASFL